MKSMIPIEGGVAPGRGGCGRAGGNNAVRQTKAALVALGGVGAAADCGQVQDEVKFDDQGEDVAP